ncbi:mevalonate kinase : Marine sediment metagenome DNA, contig: S01H1_S08262 (Fragment) OS=marine sediment metagenome GN=S01H1_36735 PE=4 SV=1: GHMP_kinases_N: GHMP_kinases_C [Gemmata massiliana]|uniref:GHMP kinase N-terminal domain-containing protein n=1 Tax=Gemmata massiliana TaxID=1210884 RepID=A0A6P2D4G9_9BACT
MPTVTRAYVPARICLAGENVDWLAGPVMTVALADLRTEVAVSAGPDDWVDVRYESPIPGRVQFPLDAENSQVAACSDYIEAVVRTVAAVGSKLSGLRVTITSTVPVTGGLASSAALCVAGVAALARHSGLSLSPGDVAALAYSAERTGMGIECGQMDQYAVAVGGLLSLGCSTTPPAINRLPTGDDIRFVVGTTGSFAPFSGVVSGLKLRWQEAEPGLIRYVARTVQAIHRTIPLLDARVRTPQVLGELVNECQDSIERDKGVKNQTLERLIAAAKAAGAYGAKSTGARETGGSMFAVTDTAQVEAIVQAIKAVGGIAIASAPDLDGIVYDTA